jgi:hypothetical protein
MYGRGRVIEADAIVFLINEQRSAIAEYSTDYEVGYERGLKKAMEIICRYVAKIYGGEIATIPPIVIKTAPKRR